MRSLMICLLLLVLATPALACINDVELPIHESEFRSQYARPNPPPPSPEPPAARPNYRLNAGLMIAAGGALLIGAAAIGLRARARV